MRGVGIRTEETGGREQIIKAAIEVFSRQSYDKASMREIARSSGITSAAIYYHFTNKEELLFTIIDGFSDRFFAALMGAAAQPGDSVEKLKRLISSHLDMLSSNSAELKILIQEKQNLSRARLQLVRSKERIALGVYRSCLEEMRQRGYLSGVDVTVAAFNIIGQLNWIYHWYRDSGKISFDAIRESTLNMILSGVCKRADKMST